jgi:hypothetical protein
MYEGTFAKKNRVRGLPAPPVAPRWPPGPGFLSLTLVLSASLVWPVWRAEGLSSEQPATWASLIAYRRPFGDRGGGGGGGPGAHPHHKCRG